MSRRVGAALTILLLVPPLAAATDPPPEPIPFAELLASLGMSAEQLRVGSPSDWLGQPDLDRLPFVLPHQDRVLGSPLELLRLANNLLHVASDASRAGSAGLFSGAVLTPRLVGFRGAAAPLPRAPAAPGALTAALARLREIDSSSLVPFDSRADRLPSPLPTPSAEELALPASIRHAMAELLLCLDTAIRAVHRSWLGLDPAVIRAAVNSVRVPRLLAAGEVSWPALGLAARAAGDIDRAFASLLLLEGLEAAAQALPSSPESLRWQAPTPYGRLVVAGGDADVHRCAEDCLLIVDLGGDDRYEGSAAGAIWPQPVALVLDLGGNDRYDADGSRAAQGSGIGAVGILMERAGDDLYRATGDSQAFGLLGYGLLVDVEGSDDYLAVSGGQGAAVFGGALLLDRGGADRYRLEGEGQGFGGSGAAAALVDLAGDDQYDADPLPHGTRGDVHTGGRVATSNAQGAGVGRRGDLTDGHFWAGGLGALIDLVGNDHYTAGTFAQGVGFAAGSGLLLDGRGDDIYRSAYFSQGSAAHFAAGLLWDGAGADQHLLDDEAGASLGYGWDFALGVLGDGGGNDTYRGRRLLLGVSQLASSGLLLELGGDDTYDVPAAVLAFGRTQPHPHRGGALDAADTSSGSALFLDCGGRDRYPSGALSDGARVASGSEQGGAQAVASDLEPGSCGSSLRWLAGAAAGGGE